MSAAPPAVHLQPPPDADASLAWHSWSDTVFAAAAASQRPVLLYLATPGWDGIFASRSAALRELVESAFVSVRVDPLQRPDLALRYAPGGWPALVLMLPDGGVFARAVDVPPRNTRMYLRRLLRAFRSRRATLEHKVAHADSGATALYPLDAEAVYRACVAAYDTAYGGFGSGVKFAEPLVLSFLQAFGRRHPDLSALSMARHTLDALCASAMLDPKPGGIHTFSYTPDWRAAAPEIDAAGQALLIMVMLEEDTKLADESGGEEHGARVVRQLLRYVQTELYDPGSGALHGRQVQMADGSWWTDPYVYADRQALLTRALARAARRLRDPALEKAAAHSAAYLTASCMDSSGAVRHLCASGGAVGLLCDEAAAGLALLEMASIRRDAALLVRARGIAAYMRAHLNGPGPAFRDRPAAMELAGLREKPFLEYMDRDVPAGNALAAEFLEALGEKERALAILRSARLRHPASRRHAAMACALLRFSSAEAGNGH